MKKVNFNSAKNIPVPDEWIEKALTLSPPAHESKKQTRKKAYLIATAASIVAAVALAAFLSETLVTPKIQSQLSATISQSTPTFVTSTNPFETVPQEFQEDTSAAQIASVCEITVTEPQEEMTDLFDTDENIVEQTEKEMTEPFYNSFVEETTVLSPTSMETDAEKTVTPTSYPFVPPTTSYISGEYADNTDIKVFAGILVFRIDERFRDSDYLFLHISEHGIPFAEKYSYFEFVAVTDRSKDTYSYSPKLHDIALNTESVYDLEIYDERGNTICFSDFQLKKLYGEISIN